MKIAIEVETGERWLAGMVTLEDLFIALSRMPQGRPEIALLIGPGTGEKDYRALLPYVSQVLRLPPASQQAAPPSAPRQRRWVRWLRRLRLLPAPPPARPPFDYFADLLQRQQVDCLFTGSFRERATPRLPCLTWFYDFQHKHLPDLFSDYERQRRDKLFRREAQAATLVLVKSEAIRRDLAAYLPEYAGKARVVPWVTHVPAEVYAQPLGRLLEHYHLPERFFYLPNQFWAHKNHAIVLEALDCLRQRGLRPAVVCTGGLVDSRLPNHAADIFKRVSERNLRDQFLYLGIVPRDHVFGLMRQAVGLLSPSLFEGFGLSVAESRSLGKRALISDLPAHREQAPPDALFFDPKDPGDLAAQMEALWANAAAGPDLALEEQARAALPARELAFADQFMDVVKEAAALWKPGPAAVDG